MNAVVALRRYLKPSKFGRRIAVVSAGTTLGQLILVLSSPILTRLFTPSDFGVFASFLSAVSIFTIFASLRYEFAVPGLSTDRQARQALFFILQLVVVNSLLACLFFGWVNASLLQLPELASLGVLSLMLLATVINAFNNVLMYFVIYKGLYNINAFGIFSQYSMQAAVQILLGAAGFGAIGLIIGFVACVVIRMLYVLTKLSRLALVPIAPAPWRQSLATARNNWRYPVFNGVAGLMQTGSQMLPALLMAVLYDVHFAGIFALCQRVLGVPVRAVSEAASQVFLGTAAKLEPAQRKALYWTTLKWFGALGLVGGVTMYLIAEPLTVLAFGEAWRDVATMIQLMLPFYLSRFIVVPISQILNLANLQHYHLWIASLNFAGMCVSFFAGWLWQSDILTTVALYSWLGTLAFMIYLGLTMRCVKLISVASNDPLPPSAADRR